LAELEQVLAAERRDTDAALHEERACSDARLRGRDDMLAMIAHDLRNYLHAIGLKAKLLTTTSADLARCRKVAGELQNSCEIMQRWANDLVDVSSMETGGISLEQSSLDPADVVRASCRAFLSAAREKGVQLSSKVPKTRPHICGDRDRLVQVVNNLLDNAIKFISGPGTITVAIRSLGRFVRFSVSDTGPGILEEDHPKIFQRYWRSKRGTGEGTGLGLFICRRIVEAHGGQISVESQPGRGTTVLFTVPVADHVHDRPQAQATA
jgi:signal transduction histidine kinase